jgi:tetratricopeptide (TPR) repeat protein
MKVKPPPDRRKFADEWDEIRYLYDKLLYWLYQREDVGKARPYAERLERLLRKADPDHKSILGEECWSLVYEVKGDLQKAIEHRKHEIDLIRRFHKLSQNSPHKGFLLRDYGYGDLSDRLDLLATLYHDAGQLNKAIETLQQSKELCDSHGIRFDGEELLREYLRDAQLQAKSDLNKLTCHEGPAQ